MGQRLTELNERLIKFINDQQIFFVATAGKEGRVNLSPKGGDTFRVLSENEVIWLNLTGSGNETAAHVLENGRMTVMFCAFEGKPLILRLYGDAEIFHVDDPGFENLSKHFPELPGTRQIFKMRLDLVQTSCGMSVPLFEFKDHRTDLNKWAEKQGPEGIREYWEKKNTTSLDGKPTGMND